MIGAMGAAVAGSLVSCPGFCFVVSMGGAIATPGVTGGVDIGVGVEVVCV